MHFIKDDKIKMKQQINREIQDKEDKNRMRINHHRATTKMNIECNKKSVFDENLSTRA